MKKKLLLLLISLTLVSCVTPAVIKKPDTGTVAETVKTKEAVIPSTANEESSLNYILGYQAEMEGRWAEALKYYEEASKLDPVSPYLKVQTGRILLRTGKVKTATEKIEEVIKAYPDYLPALRLLGELYNGQKKTADAIRIYEKIARIDPNDVEAQLLLGVLYASEKKYSESTEVLEKLLKNRPR